MIKMTHILLISHDIPSMSVGATIPIYHMIKNLSEQYDITLVCFNSKKYDIKPLEKHLSNVILLDNPVYDSFKDQFTYTFKNMLSYDNLKMRSFFNYYYHPKMSETIKDTLENYEYDIIITDMPMAFYVKNIKKPKIVYAFDAVGDYNHHMAKKATSIQGKLYWYLNYMKIHQYEKCYNKFDECIVVNNKDKKLLEHFIKTPISVVANGVDIEYFKNKNNRRIRQLIFVGDMSTPPNNDAVRYFVDEIYPLILREVNIPFKIIGRNPTDYIKSLDSDPNITVTGSVDDIRKHLNPGSIFITPMISGTGIKNKILEAMSMNLTVISTKIGISGINAKNNHDFILADNPTEFKDAILQVYKDDKLNRKIAENARVFVKNNYSWQNASNKITHLIEKAIK